MPSSRTSASGRKTTSAEAALPGWVKPQLTKLVEAPPDGPDWLHEIKFDGYRMHARLERGDVRLLTRTGLDWTQKFPRMAEALKALPAAQAYLDGELCGVRPDGTTSFSMIQSASETGSAEALVFFVFDLLHVDGQDLAGSPLIDRKARLAALLRGIGPPLQYSDHQVGRGQAFYAEACKLGLEGIISKPADAPYVPDNRGLWLKTKCLNREEFVVVGWTDPEGERPHLGALLLAYQDEAGRLIYAGRVGAGIAEAELKRLWQRLQPLATERMPLDMPPPRTSRFGSPLVLSRVHWVEPRLVVEVKFLTWTEEGLLRQVIYEGVREDKPAEQVGRPQSKPASSKAKPTAPGQRQFPPRQKSLPVPRENILQLLPDAVVPSDEQLAAYWTKVADRALPHIGRRPLKLVRHVKGTTFYHMGPLPPVPDAVHQLKIEKRKGGEGTRLWVDDLAGLLGLIEIGVVEIHCWGARVDDIERPDMLVFDLDPGHGIGWEFVVESAFRLREILAGVGLDSWPKSTGGKGVHIMVPIKRDLTWGPAHELTRDLAERLVATAPERYTISAALADRPGRLFVDYLRNGRGTTAVAAYSPRARPDFPIAAPIGWKDLERGIRPESFTRYKLPPKRAAAARRLR
jgi:bifunctional non-homologous end joining protein LigD